MHSIITQRQSKGSTKCLWIKKRNLYCLLWVRTNNL